MKALVIKDFKDKVTKKTHKKRKIIDVTKERFKEINSTALGVFLVVKDKPEKASAEKPASKKK